MHGADRSGAAPMLTRCGACADFIEITQPTTPPSCSTCSRASSFFPPTTTLFSCVWSCISQDFLSPPMAAGLPSFGRIGLRLLSMLRLGISSATPCSARPCGRAPTAAAARIFNTEFPPATFSSRPRSRRLVGQSEFQSGADWIFRAVSYCLTTRSAETRIGAGPSALGHRRWA